MLELKEFILDNGKLEWRAVTADGTVVAASETRVNLVKALRRKLRS